jgi:ADP-ribose pyrophosphatase
LYHKKGGNFVSYTVKSSKTFFEGHICSVKVDEIVLPNGKTAKREIVVRGNASAVVPVDTDGKIIFVRQYRHAVGEEVLEIPAGMIENNEDPQICAVRELEEETGYKAGKMTFVSSMYSSIGFSTEILYLYIGENLSQGQINPDPEEFIEIERYTLDEAIDLISKGKIIDSKTIAGIFAYSHKLHTSK